jgi:VanZ family protein
MFIAKKIKNYPLSSLLVVAIWVVCLIPVPETPLNDVCFIDKWTHFVMYGTLTTVIWFEYIRRKKKNKTFKWKVLFIGGLLCPVIMGGLIELAQAYLTTCRSGDFFDFVCNSMGVLLGCLVGLILKAILRG